MAKKITKDTAMAIVKALAEKGDLNCCVGFKRGLYSADRDVSVWKKILSPTVVYKLQQRAKRFLKQRRAQSKLKDGKK